MNKNMRVLGLLCGLDVDIYLFADFIAWGVFFYG